MESRQQDGRGRATSGGTEGQRGQVKQGRIRRQLMKESESSAGRAAAVTAGKGWISDLQFTEAEPRIQRWLCGGSTQGLVRSGCTGPGVPRQGEAEDAGMCQQGHKAQGLEDRLQGQGPRETSGLRWVGTDPGRDTKT